jgi:hypothetical protein
MFFNRFKKICCGFHSPLSDEVRHVRDRVEALISEQTKLHSFTTQHLVSQMEALTSEHMRLHTFTTERLTTQVDLLNMHIHGLKGQLFHVNAPIHATSFNGQYSKHGIFSDLRNTFDFGAFVETGTYLGKTTLFLSHFNKPVYTVEFNSRFYEQTKETFKTVPNILSELGDSPDFLTRLVTRGNLPKDKPVFFYLDAHWEDHLPLREELAIIATHHPNAIVMIDDFKIDDDSGYGYDSYENNQEVSLTFLRREVCEGKWSVFFPVMPSVKDHMTNDILNPRGTAVLACDPSLVATLQGLTSSLRQIKVTTS